MKVKIRQMKLGDYDPVRDIDIKTQIQYLGKKWDELSADEKEKRLETRKSEFMINVNTGYSMVAEIGNKIVGFILAYETLPFKSTLQIHHIAILPELQGKNIGVEMYKWLIKKAQKNKIKKIISGINPDNPSSIRMHEKSGFIVKNWEKATYKIT